VVALTAGLLLTASQPLFAHEQPGLGPLRSLGPAQVQPYLAAGTELLIDAASVERFLERLEGAPPDWARVYGHGHHDPDLDERLFRLNRERDEARAGHELLRHRIAFLWSGELSGYDAESGGFKYDDLPGDLIAVPPADQLTLLQKRMGQGEAVEIDVVMAGVLVPDESVVYDFSHDQEGLGLIMPVVRVDQVVYLRRPQ
jgi:hypothetical protein